MSDALERAMLAAGRRNSLRLVRVKVTAVSPLTVQLPDGSTVPGLAIVGMSYAVNGAAVAMLAEGIIPVVLPTT